MVASVPFFVFPYSVCFVYVGKKFESLKNQLSETLVLTKATKVYYKK